MRFGQPAVGQSSSERETLIDHGPISPPLAKSQQLDTNSASVGSDGSHETHPSRNFVGRSLFLGKKENVTNLASLLGNMNGSIIVKPSPDDVGDHIPESDIIWVIPGNFEIDRPGPTATTHSLEVETGSELIRKMSADASMSASYFGFSASGEVHYSMETSIESSAMYGVYSMNEDNYSVRLKPHGGTYKFINGELVDAILQLPSWTIEDSAVIQAYKEFFESWGSHYIGKLNYGTRYQFNVNSGKQENTTKETFRACIKAEYQNVASIQGQVATETERKEYSNFRQSECVVRGGDAGAAAILAQDPTNKDNFDAWARSRKTGATDAIMKVQVDSISRLLEKSPDDKHKQAGKQIKEATSFFTTVRSAWCYLEVGADNDDIDFGKIEISAPEATITAWRHGRTSIIQNPSSLTMQVPTTESCHYIWTCFRLITPDVPLHVKLSCAVRRNDIPPGQIPIGWVRVNCWFNKYSTDHSGYYSCMKAVAVPDGREYKGILPSITASGEFHATWL